MPHWDGGVDAQGRHHPPLWPKLAGEILDQGLDPEDLVRACFHGRSPEHPPYPNQLMTAATLEKYEKRRASKVDELRLELRLQGQQADHHFHTRMCANGWDSTRAWAYTLMDLGNGLCPLYRYCGAVLEGRTQIAAFWHDRALEDYLDCRVEYDLVWGAHIPDGLRQEADALLAPYKGGARV
jgi:hypothetical protein